MDVAGKLSKLERNRTTLTALGGLGTLGYLCLLALLTDGHKLLSMEPNNVGDFLAGAFAPLAFLWLVIGYFLQAIELKQNSESLMQQATALALQVEETRNIAEHAAKQVDAALQAHTFSRINSINQTRELYLGDLANSAYNAYRALCRNAGISHLDKFEKGDREIFARRLLANAQSERRHGILETISSSSERKKAATGYVNLFEMFISTLRQLTDEGSFEEFYRQHPFGELYVELTLLLNEAVVGDEEEVG